MKRINVLAPVWKKLTSRQFWHDLPKKVWRALCRAVLAVLEFKPKDWLYEQAYPRDRYDTLDRDNRYGRL